MRCVVDDAGELPSALATVRSRYDESSANAMEAFNAKLSVDRHFHTVLTPLAWHIPPGPIVEARLRTRMLL